MFKEFKFILELVGHSLESWGYDLFNHDFVKCAINEKRSNIIIIRHIKMQSLGSHNMSCPNQQTESWLSCKVISFFLSILESSDRN